MSRSLASLCAGSFTLNAALTLQFVALSVVLTTVYGPDGARFLVWVGFASALPVLFFAPLGGRLADRFDKALVAAATQWGLAACTIGMLFITAYVRRPGTGFAAIAFAIGVLVALGGPARLAIVHQIVGRQQLPAGVGASSLALNLGSFAGPAIAAAILLRTTPLACFAATALLLCVSAICIQRIDARGGASKSAPDAVTERSSNHRERLLVIGVGLAVVSVAVRPLPQVLAPFVVDVLRYDTATYARLAVVLGTGALAGALTTIFYRKLTDKRVPWVISCAMLSPALYVLASNAPIALITIATFVLGAASQNFFVLCNILIQESAPEGARGKALGVYSALLHGLLPLGFLIVGLETATIGLRGAFWAGSLGALTTAVCLLIALLRGMLPLDSRSRSANV